MTENAEQQTRGIKGLEVYEWCGTAVWVGVHPPDEYHYNYSVCKRKKMSVYCDSAAH